jgi:hypothetical protein
VLLFAIASAARQPLFRRSSDPVRKYSRLCEIIPRLAYLSIMVFE